MDFLAVWVLCRCGFSLVLVDADLRGAVTSTDSALWRQAAVAPVVAIFLAFEASQGFLAVRYDVVRPPLSQV